MISFFNKICPNKTNLINTEKKLLFTSSKNILMILKHINSRNSTVSKQFKSSIIYQNKLNRNNIMISYSNKYFGKREREQAAKKRGELKSQSSGEEEAETKIIDNIPRYTDQEIRKMRNSENVSSIKIMEIKPMLYQKLVALKLVGLSSFLLGSLNFILRELYIEYTSSYSDLTFFFLNSALLCAGISTFIFPRHIVILLEYIPKDNKLIFTKLNQLCMKITSINDPDSLARVKYKYSPLIFLRNKYSIEYFSMTGIVKWYDDKLFNTLIPQRKVIKKKVNDKKKTVMNESVKTLFKVYMVCVLFLFFINYKKKQYDNNEGKPDLELK